MYRSLILLFIFTNLFAVIPTELPDDIYSKDLVFIYVHGFAEYRKIEPFKEKMQEFLDEYPTLNYDVMTYRWEKNRLNLLKPIEAKLQTAVSFSLLYSIISAHKLLDLIVPRFF